MSWDEYRGFTWTAGTSLVDLNPVRQPGVEFGYDRRWLYPALPQVAVDAATTSVQVLRQSGRVTAGTAVIRALDATSTKPETAGTAVYEAVQLNQVASIVSNVPRIHSLQPAFQCMIETDLRISVNDGLDELVRRQVATTGTASTVTGNVLDKVRKRGNGRPGAGVTTRMSWRSIRPAPRRSTCSSRPSSEQLYVFNAGAAAPAPYGLQVRVWKSAGTAVLDSTAFGRLYAKPARAARIRAGCGRHKQADVQGRAERRVRDRAAAGGAQDRLTSDAVTTQGRSRAA